MLNYSLPYPTNLREESERRDCPPVPVKINLIPYSVTAHSSTLFISVSLMLSEGERLDHAGTTSMEKMKLD